MSNYCIAYYCNSRAEHSVTLMCKKHNGLVRNGFKERPLVSGEDPIEAALWEAWAQEWGPLRYIPNSWSNERPEVINRPTRAEKKVRMKATINIIVDNAEQGNAILKFAEKLQAGGATASSPANRRPVTGKKPKPEAEEAEENDLGLEAAEDEEGTLAGEEGEEEGLTEDSGPTEDDVKTAIKKLAAKCGKGMVGQLLKKYKVQAIQNLKPKDYEDAIATINATLKKYKK